MNIAVTRLHLKKLVVSAMMLALCLLLPLLTGQIQTIGRLLSPMHLPVLLCGFLCGPWWGLGVGIVAPLLRSVTFGMPAPPTCFFMAAELAVYGLLAGLLYHIFPKKIPFLYVSLILSMIGGRLVNGLVKYITFSIQGNSYTAALFLADAITGTWVGIIVQIVLIPLIIIALTKAKLLPLKGKN